MRGGGGDRAPHRVEDAGRPLLPVPETGCCAAPHAEDAGWPRPAVVRPARTPPCAVEVGRPRPAAHQLTRLRLPHRPCLVPTGGAAVG